MPVGEAWDKSSRGMIDQIWPQEEPSEVVSVRRVSLE